MPEARAERSDALERRHAAGRDLDRTLPVGESSSTLDVSFENADHRAWTSWDSVPASVISSLVSVGCTVATPFASGATPPQLIQRGEASAHEANAWALTKAELVLVNAVWQSQPAGKETAWGDWELEVRVRPILGSPGRRVGVFLSASRASSTTRSADANADPDVVDLLPAAVRQQVMSAVPTPDVKREILIQTVLHGLPRQQEAAVLRASLNRAIAVVAKRTIPTRRRSSRRRAERDLHEAAWQVEALAVDLGPERIHLVEPATLSESGRVALGRASSDEPNPRSGDGDD